MGIVYVQQEITFTNRGSRSTETWLFQEPYTCKIANFDLNTEQNCGNMMEYEFHMNFFVTDIMFSDWPCAAGRPHTNEYLEGACSVPSQVDGRENLP